MMIGHGLQGKIESDTFNHKARAFTLYKKVSLQSDGCTNNKNGTGILDRENYNDT